MINNFFQKKELEIIYEEQHVRNRVIFPNSCKIPVLDNAIDIFQHILNPSNSLYFLSS